MLSYLLQIEPVPNSDFNGSDDISNQRGKNVELFEISKVVFNLKLHEIIISYKFNKY